MLTFETAKICASLAIVSFLLAFPVRNVMAQVYLTPPPRSTSERVLTNAIVNGVPTSVLRFRSELDETEVLGFYRERWLIEAGTAAKLNQNGKKSYLSVIYNNDSQTVVEVSKSPFGGTVGTLSQVALSQKVESRPPPILPLDADSTVLDIIESNDGPKRSVSLTVMVKSSLEMVRQRWLVGLAEKGFKPVVEKLSKEKSGAVWLALMDGPTGQLDLTANERRAQSGSPRTYLNLVVITPTK